MTPYPNAPGAQEAARLFQREARAIGKLDHPHILPLYTYQFSAAQQQALASLIAGKSKQEAISLLEQQPGVASAAIQLSGLGNTLPTNPQKVKYPRLKAGASTGP